MAQTEFDLCERCVIEDMLNAKNVCKQDRG